jgi:hypothetical protein
VRFLLVVLVAVLVAWLGRGRNDRVSSAVETALAWRWTPAVVGVAWAALVYRVWGGLTPEPIFHDEIAYVFQARLFAEGRWAAASPPMADLFAQPHLLVAPVMASKYPPGHSLLLSLGQRFGMPALVVLALAALRAATTFALARRLSNGAIALGTCILLLHGGSLHWAASYFSETTTGALLLVGWYALLRWHQEGGRRWIVLLALALGWCAITRPFSAVLFALPIGAVVLRDVLRTGRWRDLTLAMAVGSAVVAILPLWSARTTGDWRVTPLSLYARDYMPYDRPHFGVDTTTPRRELPQDLAQIVVSLRREERDHTVANLPRIAASRLPHVALATWQEPVSASILAVIGLAAAPPALWIGVASAVALFVGHLAHPTWATWTIYYMEIAPVLVFLTVCGLARLLAIIARAPRGAIGRRTAPPATDALVAACVLALVLVVPLEVDLERVWHAENVRYQDRFRAALARVPGPAVLFVRHAPWHSPHYSILTNGPDWENASVWVVADRGHARNVELMHRAPRRRAFVFDEARSMIDPYQPPR